MYVQGEILKTHVAPHLTGFLTPRHQLRGRKIIRTIIRYFLLKIMNLDICLANMTYDSLVLLFKLLTSIHLAIFVVALIAFIYLYIHWDGLIVIIQQR